MLVFSALVFVSATLALVALILWLSPSQAEKRVRGMAAHSSARPQWTETFVRVASPFAKLSTPDGDWDKSPLRVRFFNAGLRHPEARLIYFGLKTLLPLAFGGICFLLARGLSQLSGLALMLYVVLAPWSAPTCRTSCWP